VLISTRNCCGGTFHESKENEHTEEERPLIEGDAKLSPAASVSPPGSQSAAASSGVDESSSTRDRAQPDGANASPADNGPPNDESKGPLSLYRIFTYPFDQFFYWTMADPRSKSGCFMACSFLVSLLYVAVLSLGLLILVERVGCTLSIDQTFVGLTVMAVGASLPDCIAMGTAALHGRGSMAMSGLIGSNIFDILFGLSLPWLISIEFFSPIRMVSHHIFSGIESLIVALVCLVLSLVIHKMNLTATGAILPFLAFILYIVLEFVK